jgi:hypothetical protein
MILSFSMPDFKTGDALATLVSFLAVVTLSISSCNVSGFSTKEIASISFKFRHVRKIVWLSGSN